MFIFVGDIGSLFTKATSPPIAQTSISYSLANSKTSANLFGWFEACLKGDRS